MISKFLEYLQYEKKYSTHTITAYKNDLLNFKNFCIIQFEQKSLQKIHYNQIRIWMISLVNNGISNRSVNRKISSLKTFYKFLQKIGEVEVSPLLKHKVLKEQKKIQIPFTKEEVNKAIDLIETEDEFIAIRNKLIVELFYSTGIRRMELINIKEKDINIYNKIIKIYGKRKKERIIPLLPSVLVTLEQYLKIKKQLLLASEYLFITKKDVKIYEMLVYRIINSYFGQVSSKTKKSPHMLRHTFATHLLDEGADLNSVKELLGHSSLASTQVYTHSSLKQLKQVFNKAHPRSDKNK